MNLVFLGMPGAGKGTYAGIIGAKYRLAQLSVGEIIRSAAAKGNKVAIDALELAKKGVYATDDQVIYLVSERLKEPDCKNGVIFDNFPGNLSQAQANEGKIHLDKVFFFKADDEVLIDRLSGRLTCRKCGAIYHVKNIPPKVAGVCDKCGGELYTRDDQKPEVVKQRLQTYRKQLAPLPEYFKEKGILVELDSNAPIEEKEKVLVVIERGIKSIKR